MKKMNQAGYNLVEFMIAVGILAAMASSVIMARSFMAKQTVNNTDKAYATQKAVQMFEELRTLVNGNEKLGVSVLDDYSDGTAYNTILTTDKTVDTGLPAANPADPLSKNIKTDGNWRYLRQVQVNRQANDPNSRQVIIKVWRYASDQNPTEPGVLLATVGGMLRTLSNLFPPSQTYDLYVIAVQNIPAWWGTLPSLYPYMQAVINDIQGRNPGLILRTHFITHSAYGRDLQYVPFSNQNTPAGNQPISWVYFYPGLVVGDSGVSMPYYDPSANGLQQTGVFNVDGTAIPPSTSMFPGCPNYPVADQYNNAMRYPDEVALYQAVTNAWNTAENLSGTNVSYPFPEISERMLLEEMNSSPQSFTNAMIINLHGELLPLPPLRNYSDAAKDPGAQLPAATQATSGDAGVRVVTHPELIYYPGANGDKAETITLKVYAYSDSLSAAIPPAGSKVPAISVFFPDAAATVVGVTYVYGGAAITYQYDSFTKTGSGMSTTWTDLVNPADTAAVSTQGVGPGSLQTLITLNNTDLRCPPGPNNTGLYYSTAAKNDWLYGEEYIPCSPDQFSLTGTAPYYNFGRDLTDPTTGPGRPKNTARWDISLSVPITQVLSGGALGVSISEAGQSIFIPATNTVTFTGQHSIETRIGAAVTSSMVTVGGVPINVIPNLSRTYVWTGPNTWDQPPYTEQMQYMGDPRDCPYLDVKVGGPVLGGVTVITPNSYNWYFKNLNGITDGYVSFGAAGPVNGWVSNTGYGAISLQDDLPKYFMTI
ncbi:MAG TPA: hypothetical protein VK859_05415, partial [bacterium]|nr:hypothetical protein [bacterium]